MLRSKGFSRILDLSRAEQEKKYFEGTGALVLDRINGVAYVNLSERADKEIAEHWVQKLGYKVCAVGFSDIDIVRRIWSQWVTRLFLEVHICLLLSQEMSFKTKPPSPSPTLFPNPCILHPSFPATDASNDLYISACTQIGQSCILLHPGVPFLWLFSNSFVSHIL